MSDVPEPLESPGTTLLVEAALAMPLPSPDAEEKSRARAVSLLRDGTLSPRALRETPLPASPLARLSRALSRWLGR